jgi:predicted HD superfamily hydrolase involved in NAD metabolism
MKGELADANLANYLSFLEQWLTPKRLEHSLGVRDVMANLAEVYSLDRDRAVLAGLLHDAAKDLPTDQQASLVMESGIEIHHPCDRDWSYYLHGPVGAYFVYRELDVTDTLVLDAIVTHTYYGDSRSTNFNAPFAWCLRFADILEPSRDWSGVRLLRENETRLRELAYAGHLEEAALLQTRLLVEWFEEDNKPVHPNMKHLVQELSSRFS